MRGLGETLGELSRRRRNSDQSSATRGRGFGEEKGFGLNPGDLTAQSYVPDGLPAGAPLVVVLHGCTQRADVYAHSAGWQTLADRFGFAILAPEQSAANNPNRCFNWFQPQDISRGGGEAASIQSMAQHMVRSRDLDAGRVFVTGLSAGGAMTAALLAVYPETFAGGAVVAGLPFGVASNVQEAFAAMQGNSRRTDRELFGSVDRASPSGRIPRLSVWHGAADATVANSNARSLARQWAHGHGLGDRPDEIVTLHGWTRSVWRDADGIALIELNMLAGLGHGAPVATAGTDPIGEVGPFMLEAGVSSSLEIARFWGLAPPAKELDVKLAAVPRPGSEPDPSSSDSLGRSVMASVSPHVSKDVQGVIASALKAAGLLG